jgi:hypothetical protein
MTAPGADGGLGAGLGGIEVAATEAVEGHLAPLRVKERVVTAVIIDPDPEEKAEDKQAVGDGTEREIHGAERPNGEIIPDATRFSTAVSARKPHRRGLRSRG